MAEPNSSVRSRARQRTWRVVIGVVGVLIVLGLLAGWIALRHIPAWYEPAYVPPEDEQDARDELGQAFSRLSEGMAKAEPFDFVVSQEQLNAWLMARGRIWPESRRWIPPQLERPMVVFGEGSVILAGTWAGDGPRTVLSVELGLEVQGDKLRVFVTHVRAGSLPIPLAPIKRVVRHIERQHDRDEEGFLDEGTSIVEAIEGAPVPVALPWSQPKGRFLVREVEVKPGAFRVRLEPRLRGR